MLDEDCDAYDGEQREGEVNEERAAAGTGLCRQYEILDHIWNDCVPHAVISQIKSHYMRPLPNSQ